MEKLENRYQTILHSDIGIVAVIIVCTNQLHLKPFIKQLC